MFGAGRLLLSFTRSWRPWQRYALAVALVVAGAGLVVAGVGRGAVLVVVGALVLVRAAARRRPARAPSDETPAPPAS